MKAPTRIINHDDPAQVGRFIGKVRQLTGLWEWSAKPWKPKRSNRANSYVWAGLLSSFQVFNEAQGVFYSEQEAFDILKRECLPPGKTYTSKRTGEIITLPARSSKLNSGEFSDFIELVRAYLSDIGADVPDAVNPESSSPRRVRQLTTGGAS